MKILFPHLKSISKTVAGFQLGLWLVNALGASILLVESATDLAAIWKPRTNISLSDFDRNWFFLDIGLVRSSIGWSICIWNFSNLTVTKVTRINSYTKSRIKLRLQKWFTIVYNASNDCKTFRQTTASNHSFLFYSVPTAIIQV